MNWIIRLPIHGDGIRGNWTHVPISSNWCMDCNNYSWPKIDVWNNFISFFCINSGVCKPGRNSIYWDQCKRWYKCRGSIGNDSCMNYWKKRQTKPSCTKEKPKGYSWNSLHCPVIEGNILLKCKFWSIWQTDIFCVNEAVSIVTQDWIKNCRFQCNIHCNYRAAPFINGASLKMEPNRYMTYRILDVNHPTTVVTVWTLCQLSKIIWDWRNLNSNNSCEQTILKWISEIHIPMAQKPIQM